MTAADLEELIAATVRVRSRRGMPEEDCGRLRLALSVPCDPRLGCSAAAGVECANVHDGGPLRCGFHHCRGRSAGVRWAPTSARDLAGVPRQNDDARARMHFDNTGEDLPGYLNGRRWSPDGSHLHPSAQRGRDDR